jgi:hypothetical protein
MHALVTCRYVRACMWFGYIYVGASDMESSMHAGSGLLGDNDRSSLHACTRS